MELDEANPINEVEIEPYLGLERICADYCDTDAGHVQSVAQLLHVCIELSIKNDCIGFSPTTAKA
jgi:hypothetical protein